MRRRRFLQSLALLPAAAVAPKVVLAAPPEADSFVAMNMSESLEEWMELEMVRAARKKLDAVSLGSPRKARA